MAWLLDPLSAKASRLVDCFAGDFFVPLNGRFGPTIDRLSVLLDGEEGRFNVLVLRDPNAPFTVASYSIREPLQGLVVRSQGLQIQIEVPEDAGMSAGYSDTPGSLLVADEGLFLVGRTNGGFVHECLVSLQQWNVASFEDMGMVRATIDKWRLVTVKDGQKVVLFQHGAW